MSVPQRAFALLFLHACLLTCSVLAKAVVSTQESVEVFMDQSAEITCQYRFTNIVYEPKILIFQWFVRAERGSLRTQRIVYFDPTRHELDVSTEYNGRIQVFSEQQAVRIVIMNARLSDNRDFFCFVNGLEAGSGKGRTRLRVFAPPDAPVIEGVPAGINVTNDGPSEVASCEVRNGFPKPNITWYKDSVPLKNVQGYVNILILSTLESSGFYSVQSTLQYKVTKEDNDAQVSCKVSFFVPGAIRTVESQRINITVNYPTTMMELRKGSPHGLVKEGDTVELHCQGDGNPPPHFIFNREQEPDVKLDSTGDVLILPSVSRIDSGNYQCHPLTISGPTNIKGEVLLTVHYLDEAVVVPKDSKVMLKGEDLTATCNALSSLKTSTAWYKDGKQVGQGNTLHLQDATYETSGVYKCEVTVPTLPALNTSSSVEIIVQGGPRLVGKDQEVQLEEAEGRMVNLSCEALGYPVPNISWSIIGSQNWHEVVTKANETMTHSMVLVKVTSDTSALCNASNDLGTDVKAFNIKAIPRVARAAPIPPEGSGVIIVVAIILYLLLLAFFSSIGYFLHKKGKIPCGRSGKQEITTDGIVWEMKDYTMNEEDVLLKAVNRDKKGPNELLL